MQLEYIISFPIDVNSLFHLCKNLEVWSQISPPI